MSEQAGLGGGKLPVKAGRSLLQRLDDFPMDREAFDRLVAKRNARVYALFNMARLLEVRSRLVKLSAAAARAVQRITREGEHLASVRARIACIRLDGKPSPIPQPLRRALLPFCLPEERV